MAKLGTQEQPGDGAVSLHLRGLDACFKFPLAFRVVIEGTGGEPRVFRIMIGTCWIMSLCLF